MHRLPVKIFACFLMCLSWGAIAKSTTYGLLTLGYADADQGQASEKGMGYSFAMGYELNKQWVVELGFQQLLDEDGAVPPNASAPLGESDTFKADALFVAMLGKASSSMGTLFYRVGLMSAKVESRTFLASTDSCDRGVEQVIAPQADASSFLSCTVDDTHMAGMLGLGFDFRLAPSFYLRTEIQHIRGEEDFQANTLQLGLRYDF
ncbi:outer membrane beta-barrel protein [Aliiglaciecola sp. CAU 1673]|uniref:outer membrane beta-barrel protein n=1 Tax=Aliiglaciecola sp. CAU 1673 TaxID=3032595 RepID=UPI0023DB3349|nr:outer membrane beta-barrel protein [Aliiglaciecola sp. CAU 1673]MDF2180049.1 outer membrane beta-barrel protein [Aliiglaciecola sp. CAU 1673]